LPVRVRGVCLLDDRTLEVLEYPAVLNRLAALTSFSAGREAAHALRPVAEIDVVTRRQRETAEAVELSRLGVTLPLGGAFDVRERAAGASRGQVLTPSELLDIAGLCTAAERVRRTLARYAEPAPLLATIAAGIGEVEAIATLIRDTIDEQAEVRDTASPELAQIRRELRSAHDRLHQRMQQIVSSPGLQNALQEPIVVMRDGRYVIPIKSEFRGALRGIIHDTSASGATVYIEPMAVVDLGNAWRELQVQERHEVDRVLREVSGAVGDAAEDLIDAVKRLGHLDMTQAKARMAEALDARDLARPGRVSWVVNAPAELRLIEARHPLLTGEVVPVSIHVGGDFDALLITGPNTGGKTVALKTAGLLCLMALAGLPVPAQHGSQVPVYDSIFADIGDEQSIEQSLSTFSGHITAIIDIIERAGARSLALLDEVGAGTDPTEGAALGIAIVDRLIEAGASLIATTHHSELKVYAHHTPRVTNASVEFDLETLRPTYRLSIGLPGQSNALAIARNLGMPSDVIERAQSGLSREERDMESLLGDLREQLRAAEERADRAASAAAEAEALRDELRRERTALEESTHRIREEARAEVRRELRAVERHLERTRREVEAARIEQAQQDLRRARQAAEEIELDEPEVPPLPLIPVDPRDVYPGATVWLRGVSTPGEAISEPDRDGEFGVQLGSLRTRVRLDQVERAGHAAPPPPVRTSTISAPPPVGNEIEVRGQTLDEALPRIESFLDAAARAGESRVRLIHGKGTGTLRRAVRDLLARHPLVTKYEGAERSEGGEGVTIAYLETL
jgi:DNA mismatch repair protein MutS2